MSPDNSDKMEKVDEEQQKAEASKRKEAEDIVKYQVYLLKKKLKPLKKKDLITLVLDNASKANYFQELAADLHEKNKELQKAIESRTSNE